MTDVVLDCTELYHNPVRTGIQRVVRELLLHWPADGPTLHVARFQVGIGLVAVPEAAVAIMSDRAEATRDMPYAALVSAIDAADHLNTVLPLPEKAVILLPEVFFDTNRCMFYLDRLKNNNIKLVLIAFDFLPYIEPALFRLHTTEPLMYYLRLVQAIPHIAHISAKTRDDYVNRVMRGCAANAGIVLPLGSDGLRLDRQEWNPNRRSFVVLGSLDGRKNQHVIIDAFVYLWSNGRDVPLTLIGRAFENFDTEFLEKARAYPQFRWLKDATDAEVSAELTAARATIYIPEHEGFGLPPVESLFVGIPVIATEAMPSLSMLPTDGQIRIARPEAHLVADAVEQLANDDYAEALWLSASQVQLSTWRDFAAATARWIETV